MSSFHTKLTTMLDIKHPIFLAPMGMVSGGKLAGTVSATGALGIIGQTMSGAESLKAECEEAVATYREHLGSAAKEPAPLGIGFITFFTIEKDPKLLDIALSYKPKLIQLSFGEFKQQYFDKIHSAGSLVCCQIQTVKEAIEVAKKGADIIVAQGYEAGGHGASHASTLMVFLPEILQELGLAGYGYIPVVAAGGICTGQQFLAALALGADGVTMGTRLMCSDEYSRNSMSDRCVETAVRLCDGGVTTIRSTIYDQIGVMGFPLKYDARIACTNLTSEGEKLERDSARHDPDVKRRLLELLPPEQRDEPMQELSATYVSQGVGLINEILPAKHIIQNVIEEAQQAQKRMSKL